MDELNSGKGNDLLIGASTIYDQNRAALNAIMAEWSSTNPADPYATKVANLTGTGSGASFAARLNGSYFLNSTTVLDDVAKDTLHGGGGRDLFFAKLGGSSGDKVTDQKSNEMVITL